ncbi:phytoene desaturase family protein [Aeromicrobium sp. CF3.5]|uniref:phytoene desaturase family protein n=1 Tax=Aeromicrobium sp. CF3.5 TaxID=3373078 RepID=UPI003EE6DF15
MANIVVVGGGFAGMSAAARLAKLRHDVTVLEAGPHLGGRLHGYRPNPEETSSWPLDVETVTLPGVFRDLFRKSGRTLERSLEMTLTQPRRHLFRGGEQLDLPFGDRALQNDAIASSLALEPGLPSPAGEWADWVDAWPDAWDVHRRRLLDRVPLGRADLDRAARRTLRVRQSISRRVDRDLDDDRLAKLVLDPLRLEGLDRRTTPAFTAVSHYLDRTFGRWAFEGGFPALAEALETRLGERRVAVCLDESAHELAFTGSGASRTVAAVVTDRRSLDADLVIWCAPTWPGGVPTPPGLPVIPATRTLLTLSPDAPMLPPDVLLHTNPPLRVISAAPGRCTLVHLGGDEDPVISMVRAGLDLREHVVDRVTLSPSDLVRLGHWGWVWNGWSSLDDTPGVGPRHGVHFAGAHAWSGGTPEQIGMATAAIAAEIGAVPR